jgi:cytochrome c peroxidase
MNLSLQRIFFWDGRATTLEEQALAPIENPVEMNLPVAEAVLRLKQSNNYTHYFDNIFNSEPTALTLAQALAAFERTLETVESPFDQWRFSNDSSAVDDEVKRGFAIFNGKAKCVQCHFGADFTTNQFEILVSLTAEI